MKQIIQVPFYCYSENFEDYDYGSVLCKNLRLSKQSVKIDITDDCWEFLFSAWGWYTGLPKTTGHEFSDSTRLFNQQYPVVTGSALRALIVAEVCYVSSMRVDKIDEEKAVVLCEIDTRREIRDDLPMFKLESEILAGRGFVEEPKQQTKQTEVVQKKEGKTMNNLLKNFNFGKAGSNYNVNLLGGISYKGHSYINGEYIVTEGMELDFDCIYKMPSNEVNIGDIVELNGSPIVVTEKGASIKGISLGDGAEVSILPESIFGMKIFSKIVSPFSGSFGANFGSASGTNPMMNLMMMKTLLGDSEKDDNLLMMMMMSNGGFNFGNMFAPAQNQGGAKVENKG